MFSRLLVPLDGSVLAEAVLPVTLYLARTLSATVTLIHVIEQDAPLQVHGERHLTTVPEATAYLEEVTTRYFPLDLRPHIEQHVHTGQVSDVACTIADHVGEFDSDLIVMCTHGRSGLRNWLFGSIAQQTIVLGKTPILLIRPTEAGTSPPFLCRRILVPLDGQPDHEQAAPIALNLAHVCGAEVQLLRVVPTVPTLVSEEATTARLLPSATAALLDITEQKAQEYLEMLAAKLKVNQSAVEVEVGRGDPARCIVQTARQMNTDLIVLATHGKKGADAFWSGSLTPKVSGQCRQPLLLVPVHNRA
jgi:nucleotide-binding universal stress UspA family protein